MSNFDFFLTFWASGQKKKFWVNSIAICYSTLDQKPPEFWLRKTRISGNQLISFLPLHLISGFSEENLRNKESQDRGFEKRCHLILLGDRRQSLTNLKAKIIITTSVQSACVKSFFLPFLSLKVGRLNLFSVLRVATFWQWFHDLTCMSPAGKSWKKLASSCAKGGKGRCSENLKEKPKNSPEQNTRCRRTPLRLVRRKWR